MQENLTGALGQICGSIMPTKQRTPLMASEASRVASGEIKLPTDTPMCAIGSDVIATGDNSAGNGGDGYFSGALMHAPVAVFDPINIAMAGLTGRETERHTLHSLS